MVFFNYQNFNKSLGYKKSKSCFLFNLKYINSIYTNIFEKLNVKSVAQK